MELEKTDGFTYQEKRDLFEFLKKSTNMRSDLLAHEDKIEIFERLASVEGSVSQVKELLTLSVRDIKESISKLSCKDNQSLIIKLVGEIKDTEIKLERVKYSFLISILSMIASLASVTGLIIMLVKYARAGQ